MKADAIQATYPQRLEAPLVLEAAELALDRGALPVGSLPAVGLARDERVKTRSLPPH
jgi:3-oxoacyl-(acyl-carrier-protein) synthase